MRRCNLTKYHISQVWIWLVVVIFVVVQFGPLTVELRPRLIGARISPDTPPHLNVDWTGPFAPGNVDVVAMENGQTSISGWIGPSTEGIWIKAEPEGSLSFEPLSRPDVAQSLGWDSGEADGYSFSISQVNVSCIWYLGEGSLSLRYSKEGSDCDGY